MEDVETIDLIFDSGVRFKYTFNSAGQLHGLIQKWHPNGQLRGEGNWVDGKKHGSEKQWYDNGQLALETNYRKDKLAGQFNMYYNNGELKEGRRYNLGIEHEPRLYRQKWDKQGNPLE